jgi:hypothetical protein
MAHGVSEFKNKRIAELAAPVNGGSTFRERLDTLIDLYENEESTATLNEIRQAFLIVLSGAPDILEEEKYSRFLVEEIESEDFTTIRWKSPDHIVGFYEGLYSIRFETDEMNQQVRSHAGNLLRESLLQYEKRKKYEKMLELLQLVPIQVNDNDELFRLRNRAYLYEMRRVRRNRRSLYGFLGLQVLLVFLVFPLLFIYAENGDLQDQIEKTTKVNMPEEGRRYFSYADGVYWSIITAGSIGYGDITPRTHIGRFIAATLGISGVVTAGVIAGLILNWVTPRRID